MILEPRWKLVHSKYESKSLGKTDKDKKKLKSYRTLWKSDFENIILFDLTKRNFEERRIFDDVLEVFMPDEASFKCNECGRNWMSAKALLIFSVYLDGKVLTIEKEEIGQKCSHCINHYELPMFNLQLMQDILEELLTIILEELYGIFDHGVEINFAPRRKGRNGNAPHDKQLCEACQNGISHMKSKRRRRRGRKEESDLASGIANLQLEEA